MRNRAREQQRNAVALGLSVLGQVLREPQCLVRSFGFVSSRMDYGFEYPDLG
jgi:hypothetical protein